MHLEILTRKENPLLKRTEVTFKAVHKAEATPTRDVLRSELAKELKATKDHVILDRVASSFGRYETLGYAKIYTSKDEALAIERAHILVRNKLKEPEVKEKKEGGVKAPKAERPAAKPEAPKKEEKAEPKAEHKPEAKAEHKAEGKPEARAEHKEEKKAVAPAEKKEEKHEEKRAEGKPEAKKAAPKKKEA